MSQQNGSSPLLLIVDDEQANLALLKRLFEPYYRVMCVGNGQDALDLLAQAPFDLVLLDIMMPGMDGLQTLQHIRSKPTTADLPVILVSALSDVEDVVRGLQLGANDYVTKPVEVDLITARVQTQLTLKRLQDERKQHIVELEEAQEMKDRFLQMASHDLKGPLGNVGMAEFLLRKILCDDPSGLELLDLIRATVENMENVVKEFLDSAALQSGKLDLRLAEVEADNLICKVVGQYSLNAEKKDIAVQVIQSDGILWADEARLAQALSNFVSNAIKYSPQHTTVSVWSEALENSVRICIADQGSGIPADERDRLFTQFGKLTPRPTNGEHSSGLGLWIVKHLITIQNGQVGVECPPEGGSIFWLELPATQQSVEENVAVLAG